jgi:hypothetical protein
MVGSLSTGAIRCKTILKGILLLQANAGEDKIVFLPQNTVLLNGNQSSDDHDIGIYLILTCREV